MLGVVRTWQPTMLFGVEVSEDSTGQSVKCAGGLFSIRGVLPGWILASHFFLLLTASYHTTCLFCLHSFILLLLTNFVSENSTLILEYTICQAVFYFPHVFFPTTYQPNFILYSTSPWEKDWKRQNFRRNVWGGSGGITFGNIHRLHVFIFFYHVLN